MLLCLDPVDPVSQYNFVISKIQDRGSGYLENSKNCNISAMERPILTTFSTMMRLGLPDGGLPIKFHKFENPRWRRPPSWIIKKLQYLHNRLTNFDGIWNDDACQHSGLWQPIKFCEFKNPRWSRWSKTENRKIAISLLWMDQFRENLAQWCASILQTSSAYKIVWF